MQAVASRNGSWIVNRRDGTVYGLSDEVPSDLKVKSIDDFLYSNVSGGFPVKKINDYPEK